MTGADTALAVATEAADGRADTAHPMPSDAPARRGGVLRLVAAGIEGFLLEPAEPPAPAEPAPEPSTVPPRPVIAVVGLARRCGATMVARALAAELAGRDPAGAAAVASGAVSGGIPLATSAAGRLAASLRDVPGASATAVGRLCLVDGAEPGALAGVARHHAPLVLDAGASTLDDGAIEVADSVLLVTTPGAEPALARVVAECIGRSGPEPAIAVNRSPLEGAPIRLPAVALPESRMGAQLALGGRLARGELGRAIAALADRCEEAA